MYSENNVANIKQQAIDIARNCRFVFNVVFLLGQIITFHVCCSWYDWICSIRGLVACSKVGKSIITSGPEVGMTLLTSNVRICRSELWIVRHQAVTF